MLLGFTFPQFARFCADTFSTILIRLCCPGVPRVENLELLAEGGVDFAPFANVLRLGGGVEFGEYV
jgi:hypothetical protein